MLKGNLNVNKYYVCTWILAKGKEKTHFCIEILRQQHHVFNPPYLKCLQPDITQNDPSHCIHKDTVFSTYCVVGAHIFISHHSVHF